MKDMLNLNNITLVSVSSVNIERTITALKHSMKGILFGDVILLTDKDVSSNDIKIVKIEPIDYIGYSHFIIYELYKYVNTEFVLIIQEDGFVVNPDKWNYKFLDYDYLGAPFPIPNNTDKISYRDPFGNLQRVGNGGFSLRSKKILELPTKLNLEWKPYFGYYNEDGFFAVHNKHIFEENGCKFPSPDIAANFSIEYQTPETIGIKSFGFHGKHNNYYKII
jgi:hypothetical protein